MRSLLFAGAALVAFSGNAARADVAHFQCELAAPTKCYFRIFYAPRGVRVVILPAGMKQDIPGLTIGRDTYCVAANVRPPYQCTRKVIGERVNY